LEINKTVIVASRWFLLYLTYIDDARSNTNQVYCNMLLVRTKWTKLHFEIILLRIPFSSSSYSLMANTVLFWYVLSYWVERDVSNEVVFGRRFRWPHGLRCRSAAARWLEMRVRVPPGAWKYVCCEC